MSLEKRTIGQVATSFDVSAHTLRYYEKIGLLPPISKTSSGHRVYDQHNLDRLKFIKRAQRMHFTLKEIGSLIDIDQAQSTERDNARRLVAQKLRDIDESLKDLKLLKTDLSQMLKACVTGTEQQKCPIIEGIKDRP